MGGCDWLRCTPATAVCSKRRLVEHLGMPPLPLSRPCWYLSRGGGRQSCGAVDS
jgi:hypothetical protein